MKIDIHVHTKKTKSGDSEYRNIDDITLKGIISLTDVKILAITNHNHFDLLQYNKFVETLIDICQIWPGIELDIDENGRKGHLLVVVNPKYANEFSEKVHNILNNKTPDNFTINIKDTVECFDPIEPIYIPHYYVKKPNLLDADIEELMTLTKNEKRVLKEATNAISAGIYVSHGHKSIYGSDVQNWNEYISLAKELPDLRLPVESFEQFCLLLEKDDSTITTLLDKKTKESIAIAPFGIAETIELEIYNDINILFGSKGTGKTEILKALSKYYNSNGYKTDVYESSSGNLNTVYDVKGIDFNIDIKELGIEECVEEMSYVKNSTEKEVTSLLNYYRYFSVDETNKISKMLKIKDINQEDNASFFREFNLVREDFNTIENFIKYLFESESLVNIIGEELMEELSFVIEKVWEKLQIETNNKFITLKSIEMLNNLIKTFHAEIARKTGRPEKPIKTGFYNYASNRISIERKINKIIENILKEIKPIDDYVGDLGAKGKLYLRTNIKIQNGDLSDSNFTPVRKVTKIPQKEVAKKLISIQKHVYTNELFEKIAELNMINGSDTINSISDLVVFYRHFRINDDVYRPSNGESSMVLLHNELSKDRDIYLIDEPEKSLGNDYINDMIVPLLKDHAQRGKRVIIATHDANIAVRTLPYNSIYREHDNNSYNTYVGNPFSNNLICINKEKENLDWKYISMKTLEGGKEAFGERGKIYGTI